LREYLSWPKELRSILPNLEGVVSELKLDKERDGTPKVVKRRYKKKRKLVGPRRVWDTASRSKLHSLFTKMVAKKGNMSLSKSDALEIAKEFNCTLSSINGQFYLWKSE